jgi:hypothetical protein
VGTIVGILSLACGYILDRGVNTVVLTDISIRKAKTKERAYKVSDGGLYLWVTPEPDWSDRRHRYRGQDCTSRMMGSMVSSG